MHKSSKLQQAGGAGLNWISLLLLAGMFFWLLVDAQADQVCFYVFQGIQTFRLGTALRSAVVTAGFARTVAFIAVLVVAIAAIGFECAEVWLKGAPKLSTRRLLYITTVVGCWCGLLVGHTRIAWQGKWLRSLERVDALEQLAGRLHRNWPSEDGSIEGLGPFVSYPFGKPTILLLLTPYPLQGSKTVVAAIERSNQGILRFQLGGSDGGDWLEWHAAGDVPQSFTGGLNEQRQLERYSQLRHGWFLSRYSDKSP